MIADMPEKEKAPAGGSKPESKGKEPEKPIDLSALKDLNLDGKLKGKGGKVYPWRGALCLETQHFPDSPNQKTFPSTILQPGKVYSSKTVMTFTAR